MNLRIFLLAFFTAISPLHSAETINFSKAKSMAHKWVFTGSLRVDYYCGCQYNEHKEILWNTCGYKPRKNPNRGKRLEWEHVVPAYYYARNLPCYERGGRSYCEKVSPEFQRFEGDLHNLRPSVGELNADRSNKLYGLVTNSRNKRYGRCEFYTNKTRAEPPPEVRGDLARITLYMIKKYNIVLPYDYLKLMEKWDKDDPIDEREREIDKRIFILQGDSKF